MQFMIPVICSETQSVPLTVSWLCKGAVPRLYPIECVLNPCNLLSCQEPVSYSSTLKGHLEK